MAELVADDALELVAVERVDRAARYRDDRVRHVAARGERVDAVLLVHDVDRRNARSRGDRHLLDDVEKAALEPVGGARQHAPRADHAGDGRAASRPKPQVFPQAHAEDRSAGQEDAPDVHPRRHGPRHRAGALEHLRIQP